jgi:hypothetical protein
MQPVPKSEQKENTISVCQIYFPDGTLSIDRHARKEFLFN